MNPDNSVRFGKYLLLERIGIGGMAEVFKAKLFGAEGFERLIAIKRILPNLVEDEDFVKMFVDEAKIAVRLNHPNIVGIQDLGKAEGTLYIAMEYVTGKDLRAIYDLEQKRGARVPIGIAAHVVMKMCEALHHAHFAQGPRGEPLQVIHRDVSPQNVLVSFDGEVKVADFGLAKARGRMVQTQAGVVKGKLAYMSPEQLRGDEIDHRVDVFGLGIVLFELLTGERLFLGPSDMDTLRRVYEAKVPPMAALNPEVTPPLEAIVQRALAKDRDERYATALELHDDLQAFVYGHGVYAGASSLRKYMREAFPQAAPSDEAPPFAEPSAPERVTARPPARVEGATIPPPAPVPAESGVQVQTSAPPPPSEVDVELDALIEVDVDLGDERPTDRPPAAEPILSPPPLEAHHAVTRQIVAPTTARPSDASGTVPASSALPHVPEGVFVDEYSTEQHESYSSGPDTNPAPAPLEGAPHADADFSDPWDEPTMFTPVHPAGGGPLVEDERTNDDLDDLAGEATQVVDPAELDPADVDPASNSGR